MNDLSWMIYLADAAGKLGTIAMIAAALIAIIGGAAIGIGGLVCIVNDDDTSWVWPWAKRYAFLVSPLFLIAVLTPSSNTIYAIAASEMGEEVINSPTAGKAMKALDAWLDKQIGDAA